MAHCRSRSVALRSFSEVVRRLVCPGFLLLDLTEQIIQQRRSAKAIAARVEPRVAQRLFYRHEIMQCLLCVADSTRGLHADCDSSLEVEIANRLEHHLRVGECRCA